ncbi:MAG: metallophosphoesterase [Nannocystaceae bacterium]
MDPSLALSLALVAACGDDPSASSATWTSSGGPGSGDATETATGAASTGEGSGSTGEGSGSSSGEPGSSSGGVDSESEGGSDTGVDTESDTDTDTDTDGPLLPGCGETPPMDFDAKPSAPANNAEIVGESTELAVELSGEILADASAKFYVREVHALSEADDFTIVILPDTQNYTQAPGNYPQYQEQTQWIWDHRNSDRIVAVLHNGDIVQHGNIEEIEWERAETAMETLESEVAKFPDGIPYGLAVGNHDNGAFAHDDAPFSTAFFNKYFGVSRFKDRAYYGGHYGKKNDNSWIVVRAGNLDVVMVNFEYRGAAGQEPEVLAWATDVFNDHPDALGIVNSHYIVRADGSFGAQGKAIYNAMKKVKNVQLMTSGHIKKFRARRADTYDGRKIHSMLADYQDLVLDSPKCGGGCGYMRLWRFSPMKNQLRVETYSPSLKKYMTGPQEQFTLTVDLSKATGVFALEGATHGPGPELTYTLGGLKPGGVYEWYAVVKECGAKVTTATRHFTVQ